MSPEDPANADAYDLSHSSKSTGSQRTMDVRVWDATDGDLPETSFHKRDLVNVQINPNSKIKYL